MSTANVHEVMSSRFLDDFSPEIRAMIYGFVFGSSEAITPLPEDYGTHTYDSQQVEIQTSILATNKQINAEAIEILYNSKIIRGTTHQLYRIYDNDRDFRAFVRNVEVADCIAKYDQKKLRTILLDLKRLLRIRSIVVLADCLADTAAEDAGRIGGVFRAQSVMQLVERARLGRCTCIDIGRYQLHGKLEGVQIVHRKIVKMWPAVQATPNGYNGFKDAMAIIGDLGAHESARNVAMWASQTSLRCWVDLHQQFLAMCQSGKWEELQHKARTAILDFDEGEAIKNDFFAELDNRTTLPIRKFALLSSSERPLRELQPSDHGDLLREASEFLAYNMTAYFKTSFHVTAETRFIFNPINWGRNDDGMTTIELMFEKQAITLSGGMSEDFVLDPCLNMPAPADNLIDREMALTWLQREPGIMWLCHYDLDRAIPKMIRQLTFLYMAITPYGVVYMNPGSGYHVSRDAWSARLLKSYFLATECLDDVERGMVQRASLHDLRTAVIVLDLLTREDSRSLIARFVRRSEPTPSYFNDDLVERLGWVNGRLLAKAAQRYLFKERSTTALAGQWVKESTMWD